ncbi:MAG: GNAT family N-acetyltransferase [Saccharofermentanales bacterium]
MALVVDKNYRNLGVGRQLMESAEQWARQTGSIGVRLVSGFSREEAHRFYIACGYHLRKEQKNFVKIFEDEPV